MIHNTRFILFFYQILNGKGTLSGECKANSVLSSHLPSSFVYDKEPGGSVGCGWGLRTFLPRLFVALISGILVGVSFYHTILRQSKKHSYLNTVLFIGLAVLVCWITLRDFSAVVKSYKWCAIDDLKGLNFQNKPEKIECKYGSFFLTCTVDVLLLAITVLIPVSIVCLFKSTSASSSSSSSSSATRRVKGSEYDYDYEKFVPTEDGDSDDDDDDGIDIKFRGSEKKGKKLLMTGYDVGSDVNDDDDDDDDESGIVYFNEQSKKRFPPGSSSHGNGKIDRNDKRSSTSSSDSSEIDFMNVNKWTRTRTLDEENPNSGNGNGNSKCIPGDNDLDSGNFDFESYSNKYNNQN